VTTLLNSEIYSISELSKLYRRRWQVELNFRHIKITGRVRIPLHWLIFSVYPAP